MPIFSRSNYISCLLICFPAGRFCCHCTWDVSSQMSAKESMCTVGVGGSFLRDVTERKAEVGGRQKLWKDLYSRKRHSLQKEQVQRKRRVSSCINKQNSSCRVECQGPAHTLSYHHNVLVPRCLDSLWFSIHIFLHRSKQTTQRNLRSFLELYSYDVPMIFLACEASTSKGSYLLVCFVWFWRKKKVV